MRRRDTGNMNGERYLADLRGKVVHDLDAERPACGIDEILLEGHDAPFETVDSAKVRGFTACAHCIPSGR